MEWRANLRPSEDGWMSKKHFACIKSAFDNHMIYFDNFDIQDIKTKYIQDWVDDLKLVNPYLRKRNKDHRVSNDYKRKLIGYLSHMLNWAKAREDITAVPKMPIVKFKRKKKKGLLENAQIEILKNIPDRDKPIFECLIETGRRINEARALKVKDLDFQSNVYRVGGAFDLENYKPFPKVEDHAEEEFPITDKLREIISMALQGRVYGPESFVFANRSGRHYTDSRLRKIYNKARNKAGYVSITLNVFGRHSKGLQLKIAGACDEEIASILGNTAKIVHETYTHVEAGGKARILSLLDKRKEKGKTGFAPNMSLERFCKK